MQIAATVVICIFFSFPIFWLFWTSFKPAIEVFYVHRSLSFTFKNFLEVWGWLGIFDKALINAGIVATLATVLSLLVALLSGYLLARFKGSLARAWFGFIYIIRTVPFIAWILPLYFIIQGWGLYDTYLGLLCPHIAFHVTFFSLVMRGFFETVPLEIEEAGRLDGLSRWGVLWRISFPLIRPGIVAGAILIWLWTWNEFLFALILTSYKTPMLTVTIIQFASEMGIEWNLMSAAAAIALLPAIVVTLLAQKYIIIGFRM